MWLNLGRKTVFVNIYPLLLVWSKTFVLTNPNLSQDFTLFKHGKKNKLFEYFSARFWDSHFFDLKEKFSLNFPKNTSKQQKSMSLAVSDSIWGEKQFLLILIPFYRFDQKQLFKQTQIFLMICPFSNMVRKTNFLSISVLVSEIVTFLTKKRSSPWISPKILQKNRNPWD